MGPTPAVAAARSAVRPVVADLAPGAVVLVACSGGADSLALLAATVFEARHTATRVVGAVVDHGLQSGSAEHTAAVVDQMARLGAAETATIRVTVDATAGGVEAGARTARYAALAQLAVHVGASLVLLGHTLDDQAENVLLGLARGSGGGSLQGMRPRFTEGEVTFVRPFLELRRTDTEAACRAAGIAWWDDPHNADRRFARARVRHRVLPVLEEELGPGIVEALARTGRLLRDDMELLTDLVDDVYAQVWDGATLDLTALATQPPAIRSRCLRRAALAVGAPASDLTHRHVIALDRIGPGRLIRLPGNLTARVVDRRLVFEPTT